MHITCIIMRSQPDARTLPFDGPGMDATVQEAVPTLLRGVPEAGGA
jgi:hypothetical protein